MWKLEHQGCDRCVYKCDNPIIINVLGQRYKGHKDCMHMTANEIRKENRKNQKNERRN